MSLRLVVVYEVTHEALRQQLRLVTSTEYIVEFKYANGQRAVLYFNPLKPTGHVMHQQFNIPQLYALPTLYLCVLYLSQNKQRLVPLTV